MPNYAGLSYDNLGSTGKLYPNPDPVNSDGTVVLFDERFGTDDGLAHLVPAEWLPAKELPSEEYPFILNTGRLLEHWHTGSMTRRSFALDAIQPEPHVFLNPDDAKAMGIADGDFVRVSSRRGTIETARAPVAPRHAGHVLHPVPLPRGGGEPADDRRDRPVRARSPSSSSARCGSSVGAARTTAATRPRWRDVATGGDGTPGLRVQPRTRAPRRAPASSPGPSLIPALNAIQRAHRLAAARGARRAVARRAPAAVRDRGPDLVLSALPHVAAEGRAARGLPRPLLLAARLRRADRRDEGALRRRRRDRDRRGLVPRPLRHRAGRGRRRAPAAARRGRRGRRGRARRRARRGRGAAAATASAARTTLRAAATSATGVFRRALAGELRPEEIVATLKDSGLRGMGGAGFPTGPEVGDRRRPGAAAASTRSATPTSPSPARSRTARSSPSSRTSCSRACCSGCS